MIKTRLTEKFNLSHPIIQAPMAFAAGGTLAAAVSHAGGLGLIGGGYGDHKWINNQFDLAGDQSVGCGFITWALRKQPELLEAVIARAPKALFLSFGNPTTFAKEIRKADIPLICQVQTIDDARCAIGAGADVIVAQGAEAGGHGDSRATMTRVPEVADLIATLSTDTLLCAAGGIGDGRGLAAALMLGADRVVIGSRFWASQEAMVHKNMLQSALLATGDDTIRSSVMDIARLLDWPSRYTARVLKNGFTDKWHNNVEELKKVAELEAEKWTTAWEEGDMTVANTFVGEVTGLIQDIKPVEETILAIVNQAEVLLSKKWN